MFALWVAGIALAASATLETSGRVRTVRTHRVETAHPAECSEEDQERFATIFHTDYRTRTGEPVGLGVGVETTHFFDQRMCSHSNAVFFYPTADHNGAFAVDESVCHRLLGWHDHACSVHVWRVGSVDAALRILNEYPEESLIHAVLGGHGYGIGLAWGHDLHKGRQVLEPGAEKSDSFLAVLDKKLAPHAMVFTDSCLSGCGVGHNFASNVAEKLTKGQYVTGAADSFGPADVARFGAGYYVSKLSAGDVNVRYFQAPGSVCPIFAKSKTPDADGDCRCAGDTSCVLASGHACPRSHGRASRAFFVPSCAEDWAADQCSCVEGAVTPLRADAEKTAHSHNSEELWHVTLHGLKKSKAHFPSSSTMVPDGVGGVWLLSERVRDILHSERTRQGLHFDFAKRSGILWHVGKNDDVQDVLDFEVGSHLASDGQGGVWVLSEPTEDEMMRQLEHAFPAVLSADELSAAASNFDPQAALQTLLFHVDAQTTKRPQARGAFPVDAILGKADGADVLVSAPTEAGRSKLWRVALSDGFSWTTPESALLVPPHTQISSATEGRMWVLDAHGLARMGRSPGFPERLLKPGSFSATADFLDDAHGGVWVLENEEGSTLWHATQRTKRLVGAFLHGTTMTADGHGSVWLKEPTGATATLVHVGRSHLEPFRTGFHFPTKSVLADDGNGGIFVGIP